MDKLKELWFVGYDEENTGKNHLVMLSARSSYEKIIKWTEENKKWLQDKTWFILKYKLSEDF